MLTTVCQRHLLEWQRNPGRPSPMRLQVWVQKELESSALLPRLQLSQLYQWQLKQGSLRLHQPHAMELHH